MRTGFAISLLLHTTFLWIVLVGLPRFSDTDPLIATIPVSIISESDLARLDALPSEPESPVEPPRAEAPDIPPPVPEPEVAALPPVPIQRPEPPSAEPAVPPLREPEPQPEVQLAPEPALPEPDLAPALAPEPEPIPEPELTPEIVEEPEPVTEQAEDLTPEPAQAEEPPETQIAALPRPPVPRRRPDPPPAAAEPEPESTFGSLLSNLARGQVSTPSPATELSSEMRVAVDEAVRECWYIDPSGLQAGEILPEVTVVIGPNGVVEDAQVDGQPAYRSDPLYRSAADRARRAVLNPKCARRVQQVGLAPNTYTFRFIP